MGRFVEQQSTQGLDLSGEFLRLNQKAVELKKTIVNGKTILEDNELTDELGGTVIRYNSR
tara:strand:+ start:623 stop:802 length:180 start_codon:yes stop_codon:yes gene_type:complete